MHFSNRQNLIFVDIDFSLVTSVQNVYYTNLWYNKNGGSVYPWCINRNTMFANNEESTGYKHVREEDSITLPLFLLSLGAAAREYLFISWKDPASFLRDFEVDARGS